MVKQLDFRKLSQEAREEIFRAIGITDTERNWLRSRGNPVTLVEFPDRYKLSRAQNKKAHALINCIAVWSGYTPADTEKVILKQLFCDSTVPIIGEMSMADCSMEVARMFITWLIDFCLLNDIPCGEPMYKLCEDIPRYVWSCLMNHRCAVCGKRSELHHVDAVGMGRNRKEICHIGMRALPLCRHHHCEIHSVGRDEFLKRYLLEPVAIDERILAEYHLGRNKQ